MQNQMDIDVVITWVDHRDEKWQQEKKKYETNVKSSESNHFARFRSWDNLKYLLRSLETYMPWVRTIFLVTCGQVPEWIVENHPKLKLVFHEEFIPKEYLPTFSSHVIELNLFRISSLSERFIYFNDDIFVLKPLKPSDFFRNGYPCDCANLHIHCEKKSLMIHSIANNDVALINEHFNMAEVIREKKRNWFHCSYGIRNNLMNLFLLQCPRFPGFHHYHLANSYLKSTFQEVWEKEFEFLDSVCQNKFRTKEDVNQWVIREWQLASNHFSPYPKHKMGCLVDFEKGDVNLILRKCLQDIKRGKFKMICINDGDTISNFEFIRDQVNKSLEEKFPIKSTFEK